jgi:hypothetical protein
VPIKEATGETKGLEAGIGVVDDIAEFTIIHALGDCFGLDHDEAFLPFLPDCRKASPEKAVSLPQSGLREFAIQNGKMLPQGKIFESQLGSIFERGSYQ